MFDAPPKLRSKSEPESDAGQSRGSTDRSPSPALALDVGDVVRWHVHGTSGPGVPAIVTRVNTNGTLALSVFRVGSPALDTIEKEAVMHADDPALAAKVHLRKAGYWTLSPREDALRKLLATMQDRLERIESKVN